MHSPATDRGVCLSMHQPWASLLVYGLKRIEGRSWSTDHRGRLWIAATAQEPDPQEIEELEGWYRSVHALDEQDGAPVSADLQLPPAYPAGVLLGCVEVVDVVAAEQVEAWEGLPAGLRSEAGSPQCFLCERPQRLVVPQQMRGQHKLYPLPAKLLKAARLGLKPAPNGAEFRWAAWGSPPPLGGQAPVQKRRQQREEQRREERRDQEQHEQPEQQRPEAPPPPADPTKRLRAVQKKLRQVDALAAKAAEGRELQPEEAEKLSQRGALEAEAARLAQLALG